MVILKKLNKKSFFKKMHPSKVYFTKEITPDSIIKIYKALNRELQGKIAVKISSGEAGGNNYLNPQLIQKFVNSLNGTLVECNTVSIYKGSRLDSKDHWKTIEDHGFKAIAPFDLLDEEGDFAIPVKNGYQLKTNLVGNHMKNYKSMVVLSHFKGHGMAGFGGAMKNMAIGLASSQGKLYVHCPNTENPDMKVLMEFPVDPFQEAMVDSVSSILDFVGRENMVYINIANRLSIDCDCVPNPKEPEMADIGVFASLDPVAVDQACVDAVFNSADPGKESLINRIKERKGIHTLELAEKVGLGTTKYEIVNI